ncbi:MAG TPA: hypothetical protein VI588_01140 [Candidatus Gracilibacteria bacterium]|nr:hypothetical protein [Candidatus Gracilibacteria bacterium]
MMLFAERSHVQWVVIFAQGEAVCVMIVFGWFLADWHSAFCSMFFFYKISDFDRNVASRFAAVSHGLVYPHEFFFRKLLFLVFYFFFAGIQKFSEQLINVDAFILQLIEACFDIVI